MWLACHKKSYLTNLEVRNLKLAVFALCGCLSFACFEKKWGKVSWIFQNSSIRHLTNTFSYDMPTTLILIFLIVGSRNCLRYEREPQIPKRGLRCSSWSFGGKRNSPTYLSLLDLLKSLFHEIDFWTWSVKGSQISNLWLNDLKRICLVSQLSNLS